MARKRHFRQKGQQIKRLKSMRENAVNRSDNYRKYNDAGMYVCMGREQGRRLERQIGAAHEGLCVPC